MKFEPGSRCFHEPNGWLARPEIATQLLGHVSQFLYLEMWRDPYSTVWGPCCGSLSTVKPRKWVSKMILRPQTTSACNVHCSSSLSKMDGTVLKESVAVLNSGFSRAKEKTRMLSAPPRIEAIPARNGATTSRFSRRSGSCRTR